MNFNITTLGYIPFLGIVIFFFYAFYESANKADFKFYNYIYLLGGALIVSTLYVLFVYVPVRIVCAITSITPSFDYAIYVGVLPLLVLAIIVLFDIH